MNCSDFLIVFCGIEITLNLALQLGKFRWREDFQSLFTSTLEEILRSQIQPSWFGHFHGPIYKETSFTSENTLVKSLFLSHIPEYFNSIYSNRHLHFCSEIRIYSICTENFSVTVHLANRLYQRDTKKNCKVLRKYKCNNLFKYFCNHRLCACHIKSGTLLQIFI